MNARHRKTICAQTISIMAAVAMALSLWGMAAAATSLPFTGQWQATDVDGSSMRVTIAGSPVGPFQITWIDDRIAACNGQRGILHGTGWLDQDNSDVLDADMQLECLATDTTLPLHIQWQYYAATNILVSRYYFGAMTIWHRPGPPQAPPPALNLRVNYGEKWVESFYEPGHVVWITVTEGDGVTLKAITEATTQDEIYPGGPAGFNTGSEGWVDAEGNPLEYPDIQPDDWVFAWADNGASGQVRIGNIRAQIDVLQNIVGGTIDAPWITQPVQVQCLDWGSGQEPPLENVDAGSIMPDGEDLYSCSWGEQWVIQPTQRVGVGYSEGDNWVARGFRSPWQRIVASELGDWFWTTGFNPGPLNLFIYESAEAEAPLLWSGEQEADEGGFTIVGADVHGQDLVPGNYLVVSDGVTTKGLVLEPIRMDVFDTDNEIMAGTAPAGRHVSVAAGPQDWQEHILVTADAVSGAWMADFKTIDFDITEEMRTWSYAQIFDADGDANEAGTPPARDVHAGNFHVKWSAVNPEEVVELRWKDSANLTGIAANPYCAGDLEFFGNSWASENEGGGNSFFGSLVGWGTTGSWAVPGDGPISIDSMSAGCPGSAGIPVHTEYEFFNDEVHADLIKIDRTFEFGSTAYAHNIRPFIPRLYPYSSFTQVLHPDATGIDLVNEGTCDFGCVAESWSGDWFAIHDPGTGLGMIVRHVPAEYSSALWLDNDAASNTNASAILLLQPAGGFTGTVTETEYLCFYDSTTWTPSLTLPLGCEP